MEVRGERGEVGQGEGREGEGREVGPPPVTNTEAQVPP